MFLILEVRGIYIYIYIWEGMKGIRQNICGKRICSPNFLNDEFEQIKNSFFILQYSESFIHCAKLKAIKIHKHISNNKNNQPSSYINSIKRYILLAQNPTTALIEKLKRFRHKNCYSQQKQFSRYQKITPKTQILSLTQEYLKSVV